MAGCTITQDDFLGLPASKWLTTIQLTSFSNPSAWKPIHGADFKTQPCPVPFLTP